MSIEVGCTSRKCNVIVVGKWQEQYANMLIMELTVRRSEFTRVACT